MKTKKTPANAEAHEGMASGIESAPPLGAPGRSSPIRKIILPKTCSKQKFNLSKFFLIIGRRDLIAISLPHCLVAVALPRRNP